MKKISLDEAKAVLILDNMFKGSPMGRMKKFSSVRSGHAKQVAKNQVKKVKQMVSKMNEVAKGEIKKGK